MLNRVVLTGRLTKDPNLKYTPNGHAVCMFTLAVNRKKATGNEKADFLNCIVWRNQAEAAANYLSKGSLVGVDGRLETRNYENQQGQRVFVTEVQVESVQFLESKKDKPGSDQAPVDVHNEVFNDSVNDDLPF
ncbi:single-stranded DNA-binding protein (plasmid) [Bacillus altitudinis]|nr:single-stranded DNA-binding protein [Bacillus altitudinis]WOI43354.1 single-stranded DNA-binding protein [Bacillus altitudinis]